MMKVILKTFLLLFLSIYTQFSIAQEFEIFNAKIDDVVKPYSKSHLFSGVVLVVENANIIYSKAYGKSDVELETENNVNTPFLLGSLTKPITATIILKLAEEGKLQLNDSIGKYLSGFPDDKASKITIHHLLGHSSGLPNYFQIEGWTTGEFNKNMSDVEFLDVIRNMQLLFEPGSRYFYSNAGYYLLGEIIEKVTGKSCEEVFTEYCFQPLGMTNSGIAKVSGQKLVIAKDYKLVSGGYQDQSDFNISLFKAGGDIFSTVDDLYRWEQALYTNELLSEESKAKLFDPENHYSWDVEGLKIAGQDSTFNTVSCNGQIEGYSSMITRFVDDRNSIIILSNTGMGYLSKKKLSDDIATVLHDIPVLKTKKAVLSLLAKALYNNELDQTIKRILALRYLFAANEQLVNEFGEQISWSGNKTDAIKVFELNTKLFPDSPSAAFQLAEIYKEVDDMAHAIEYYQKVLEHYPNNSYVKRIIEEAKP